MAVLIAMLVAVGTLLVRERQRTADFSARAAAFESSAAVLRDERDALQAQIDAPAAEVAAEGRRVDAAEENEFLRAAVVVSAASAEVDAVALTIDDGGSAEVTAHVLDVLAGRRVTATLFPTGWSPTGYPEVWGRAAAGATNWATARSRTQASGR